MIRFFWLLVAVFCVWGWAGADSGQPAGVAAIGPITVPLNAGWNGVAFQCSRLTAVNASGVAGIASFNGTAYETRNLSVADVNSGDGPRQGFWVFAPSATSFTYSGEDDGLGDFVNLRSGWNLVAFAGPGTVPGASLAATVNGTAVPLGSVVLTTFQQINPNNTYTSIDVGAGGTLLPGRPYWVFASGTVRLTWTFGPVPSPTPTPGASPSNSGLARLNALRGLGNIPPVGETASLTAGCQQHSLWMVLNNMIEHFEIPGTPGFTAAGNVSADKSVLSVSFSLRSIDDAINELMGGPFHGVTMLDPLLRNSGFGHVNNTTLTGFVIRSATTIDTNSDRPFTLPAGSAYPFIWPADGQTLDIANFTGREYPDPLAGFPGVTGPTGCPLYLIRGSGGTPPSVTAFSLTRAGAGAQEVFELDETNYVHPTDPDAQTLGRLILKARNAIVLIPRLPLVPGASYTASVTTNGTTFGWTFSVSPTAVTVP